MMKHIVLTFTSILLNAVAAEPLRAIVIETPAPRFVTTTLGGIAMQCVSFDSRTHFMRVLDQANGPGTQWADAQAAAVSVNGLAAINAGFFTPQGKPLGVVIANGKKAGGNNHSSLGAGVWYEAQGKTAIIRRERCNFNAPHLMQAGPYLAEKYSAVKGLDAVKTSARSFIAWDGGTMWMMARTAPCSLAQLAKALAGACPAGFPIHTALNLDGGRSAEMFVSDQVAGGGIFNRPIWNNPVRNFLILQKR
ncbi:MAG: hypothetical protein B9S37_11925 [Verrucomicrobiia bacterium Tous-C3TDCM]|nr:MAG: hypothetical protein B9S37_11925 [Verrucomicrobiae bacterium Tous-C3TDCM]PAZ05906.1 MAG: hypothetical protein CAK88_06145 [Verrucomicrobiae bacterium AMD-G2]